MEGTERAARLRLTSSRVKKALYDILGDRIKDKNLLDLYAGEGGIGIEALKRGAKYAVFVERSKKNAESIRKKLRKSGMDKSADIFIMDVSRFLETFPSGDIRFDVVFADPPYESREYQILSDLLPEFKGLSTDATIVIEHFHKMILPEKMGIFILLKRYRYGDTILSVYRR